MREYMRWEYILHVLLLAAAETLPASSYLWWPQLEIMISAERQENWTQRLNVFGACPASRLILHQQNTCFWINNCHQTYPWPIFSNRVYFFLGSPTLTMLPERNQIKDAHWGMEIAPSSRWEMQPRCLGLWAVRSLLGDTTTTGSSAAQMAATETGLLQPLGELPRQETKNMEEHSQETDIRKEQGATQVFVVYKH